MKTTDFPQHLREISKVFVQYTYKHDASHIFTDFVQILCEFLSTDGISPNVASQYKQRYGSDDWFDPLMKAYLNSHKEAIEDNQWYDLLGEIYEVLASNHKKSAFGQFFTPKPLCDLMAQLTYSPSDLKEVRALDPACGSGRTLLSIYSMEPSVRLFGEDKDPICARMAAINLALHGCQGQVNCMDSLTREWRFGFAINPMFAIGGPPIPHLKALKPGQVLKVKDAEAPEALPEYGTQLKLF